jgi:hypothetical protein
MLAQVDVVSIVLHAAKESFGIGFTGSSGRIGVLLDWLSWRCLLYWGRATTGEQTGDGMSNRVTLHGRL